MPPRIRLIGRYGNGLAAVLFGFFVLFSLVNGRFGLALVCALLAALSAFNVYLTEKAAAMTSEEEWLNAEIRKAELRRKLVATTGTSSPESIGRQHGV